jgi:hypothetical protein
MLHQNRKAAPAKNNKFRRLWAGSDRNSDNTAASGAYTLAIELIIVANVTKM